MQFLPFWTSSIAATLSLIIYVPLFQLDTINAVTHLLFQYADAFQPIPVATRKTWVCDRSLAAIEGSNPAGGMDVCLVWALCVVRSLRRSDHSSGGVLLNGLCLSVIVKPRKLGGLARKGLLRHRGGGGMRVLYSYPQWFSRKYCFTYQLYLYKFTYVYSHKGRIEDGFIHTERVYECW